MEKYKNTILLKDQSTGEVDAIIQSNESNEIIQKVIWKASEKYHDLDLDNNLPDGIFYELEYVIQELHKRFDCNIIEFWTKHNQVYY